VLEIIHFSVEFNWPAKVQGRKYLKVINVVPNSFCCLEFTTNSACQCRLGCAPVILTLLLELQPVKSTKYDGVVISYSYTSQNKNAADSSGINIF